MASQSIAVYVIYRMMKQAYDIEQFKAYNFIPSLQAITFQAYLCWSGPMKHEKGKPTVEGRKNKWTNMIQLFENLCTILHYLSYMK